MRIAALSAVTTLMAAATLAAGPIAPASASGSLPLQRICSSKASEAVVYVFPTTGGTRRLFRSDCANVPFGSQVTIVSDSYRVGYNYGPYSECRPGVRTFVPWQKADVIYFKSFIDSGC